MSFQNVSIEAAPTSAGPYVIIPIGWAVVNDRLGIVKLLLGRGANVYLPDVGGTTLHAALSNYQSPDIIHLLQQDYGQIFPKPEILNSIHFKKNTPLRAAGAI